MGKLFPTKITLMSGNKKNSATTPYLRPSFKCTIGTKPALKYTPEQACEYARQTGERYIRELLQSKNMYYTIQPVAVKFNTSETYKYRGWTVHKCFCIETFNVVLGLQVQSDNMSRAIIIDIINKCGSNEFMVVGE